MVVIIAIFVAAAMLAIVVVIMILPAATVVIAVAVPVMIVVDAAAWTIPITVEVTISVVAGVDPAGAFIRRLRPIAAMPNVTATHRIPVAFHPDKVGTRFGRTNGVYARWRGCADLNADGNLAECGGCSGEKGACEK
jgi:hypothetical protein